MHPFHKLSNYLIMFGMAWNCLMLGLGLFVPAVDFDSAFASAIYVMIYCWISTIFLSFWAVHKENEAYINSKVAFAHATRELSRLEAQKEDYIEFCGQEGYDRRVRTLQAWADDLKGRTNVN